MLFRPLLICAAFLASAALPNVPAVAQTQTVPGLHLPARPLPFVPVTDLGTLGGSFSAGCGVNNHGEVVGSSRLASDQVTHGFFYTAGKMIDLGTLGGDESEANALNDAGQVTGYADLKTKGSTHAFLWQHGQMSDLGAPKNGGSVGLAINRSGQVAGAVDGGSNEPSRACLWSGGKMQILDTSKGYLRSSGAAIDSHGQVVGASQQPGRKETSPNRETVYYVDQATLWQGGLTSVLSGRSTRISLAYAINDSGQIAGTATFGKDKPLHACVWQGAKMLDLGTVAGQNTVVYAVNRTGQMVGGTNPSTLNENGKDLWDKNGPQRAFYRFGNISVDLNDMIDPASGWVLGEARSISDTGCVTGSGFYNGQIHGFLLKLPSAVPGH